MERPGCDGENTEKQQTSPFSVCIPYVSRASESVHHLLLHCPIATWCWNKLLQAANMSRAVHCPMEKLPNKRGQNRQGLVKAVAWVGVKIWKMFPWPGGRLQYFMVYIYNFVGFWSIQCKEYRKHRHHSFFWTYLISSLLEKNFAVTQILIFNKVSFHL